LLLEFRKNCVVLLFLEFRSLLSYTINKLINTEDTQIFKFGYLDYTIGEDRKTRIYQLFIDFHKQQTNPI